MENKVAGSATELDVFGPDWEVPFLGASPDLARVLKANKRGFQAGTTVKLEGGDSASVYVVISGWLALSKSMEDGARQIVDIILPGGIIDPSSAKGSTSTVQIETLSYARIAVVPRSDWMQLNEDDPSVLQFHADSIAAAQSRMSERMLRLGKASAEARIAYALIELCLRVSAIGEATGNSYHLPLTQQLLGEYTGLSSVHVCRTIRRLTRGGVISMADHMDIVIHDLDALAKIAEIDVSMLREHIIVENGPTAA
ncbi:Crp/Fnr family transcriptional regulator [Ruegeria marina]|uniref:cAMP-binding domain of CRP or a regulatory subunit of cAMP-dependent protein kinases n=1 Tax=Ruegeria marina TaxID=639004 RepID=A0A1G6I868_9RHOB|nr:Crp/Fnr family transcriptional regulator [Ruegeria marina]SDC02563.1 cAMP-binding domain of CRP or a regulatory subunit of cAMP-dependent protein kinases [Ruegeria marina]